ncbi:MAG: hypothetical protein A4E40_00716 [Methanoregulaceae archaeon PtaU1.Bin059]|nr:MAG: hypothetical protein A4E40_00716 [Methanoregulaceae archaeon PtaU1.Bin059]
MSQPIATARANIAGCPAPKRCTHDDAGMPLFDAVTTSTRSPYRYDSISGTTAPTGQKVNPSSPTSLPASSRRSWNLPPCTGPATGASGPRSSFASLRRAMVRPSSLSACPLSASGGVGMSSGTKISLPIAA